MYQKAFWVIVPILIASFGSGIAAIDAEINGLDERIRNTELQVAENNVPELKNTINGIDKKVDNILISQARIEQKLDDLK